MNTYDTDVDIQKIEYQKLHNDYSDAQKELEYQQESYKVRMEEKKKRDEMDTLMKRKSDEQNAQRVKLEKASEYIQAHWKGLVARRESEKLRKKGKKKKKKK
jgi:hypothetical protein